MWRVLFFLFSFISLGFFWMPETGFADYSPSGKDWMKNLDDDLLITQITIPGTHDSAADHDHCAENWKCKAVIEFASTQTYNIRDQMDLGIRFFDVRLAYDENNDRGFEFHHGPYDLKQSIGDAIGWAKDFLEAHPSEFLIWLIKQEHTNEDADSFWRDLSDEFAGYEDLFYLKKKILTVGEARGKVIVMARNHSSEYPQGYHVEWSDNTVYDQGSDKDLTYIAEDHYKLASVYTSVKFMNIRRNLFLARSCVNCGSEKTLFFTFLSGEGDVAGKGPAHYADYENPHTGDWLTEDAALGPRAGIVAMDFAGDNSHSGDYLLDTLIGQNPPHRVPGWFGDSNDGGGVTIADINQNGHPDLVVMSIHDCSGENTGWYRIGWDLDDYGRAASWGKPQSIPQWWGWDQAGGGITASDMNRDGTPDLIVFFIDDRSGENYGYYRIGYMDSTGTASEWTGSHYIPDWFGDSNDGGGVTITDINQNGHPDLVVMSIHDCSGENTGWYRIGWDLGSDGKAGNWSGHYSIPWQGDDQSGGGITAADANNDGTPDLIVYMVDNPDGPNYGYYRIGYLDGKGTVTKWTDFERDFEWIGGSNNGGGITVDDIDQNGKLDLIPFVIYNADGENCGYYRVLWDEGTVAGSD